MPAVAHCCLVRRVVRVCDQSLAVTRPYLLLFLHWLPDSRVHLEGRMDWVVRCHLQQTCLPPLFDHSDLPSVLAALLRRLLRTDLACCLAVDLVPALDQMRLLWDGSLQSQVVIQNRIYAVFRVDGRQMVHLR